MKNASLGCPIDEPSINVEEMNEQLNFSKILFDNYHIVITLAMMLLTIS